MDNLLKPKSDFKLKTRISNSTTSPLKQQPESSESELVDQVLKRSKQLLKNTNDFNLKLKQDESILRDAEQQMDQRVVNMKSRRNEIQKVTSSTWKTTIMIWVSVLVSILVVMYMILFMKIFSVKR